MTIITLLTDFGLTDPFVGILHAIIAHRCSTATLVDLTHSIAPQDITAGAFWLERTHHWLPKGTYHLAVVDPGVGTQRTAVAARIDGHIYVGPHNGLFDRLIARASSVELRAILSPPFPHTPSATFHARDIFAPLVAALANGEFRFEEVGPSVSPHPAQPNTAPASPAPSGTFGSCQGTVVWIDHFGNLITDVESTTLRSIPDPAILILDKLIRLSHTYADVPTGELVALVSGFDTLEIAVRNGDAAVKLGAKLGTPVVIEPSRGPALSRGSDPASAVRAPPR